MSAEMVLSVFRGEPRDGAEHEYRVPLAPGMVVLDAIRWIQAQLVPDLVVRWNCKAARCGSCAAEIDGRPKLMCKTRLDAYRGRVLHVRPLHTFPLVRDLVTDVSWNYRVAQRIPPPATALPAPLNMQARDVGRSQEFHRCIECWLCQDVCHVLREHGGQGQYVGPRFVAKIAESEMHPLDVGDRIDFLVAESGIGLCNVTRCCQEVCPEAIRITDNAIIPLKERVADRDWDPVRRLTRRWRRRAGRSGPPGRTGG